MDWDRELSENGVVHARATYRTTEERADALRYVTDELRRKANRSDHRSWTEPIGDARITLKTLTVPPLWNGPRDADGYAPDEFFYALYGEQMIRTHPSQARIDAAKNGVGWA